MSRRKLIESTYKLATGPKAVDFATYARSASRDLHSLLNNAPEESDIQRFLESHPAIVPGACEPDGRTDATPLHDLLIAQPTLPGLNGLQPDFMWLTTNSDTWFPVLIEIERPSKQIFRRDGVPTAEFTQARNQLAEWRAWFRDPVNQLKFRADYKIPGLWHYREMRLGMILVYGRRKEFEGNARLTKKRASLLTASDEQLMSFDRLAPDPRLHNAITVRAIGAGLYSALQVPPTLTLGPNLAKRFLVIRNLEAAIDSSEGWSPRRRRFVKSRIPYWVEWVKSDQDGWIPDSDTE